jgi:hypothetical protein
LRLAQPGHRPQDFPGYEIDDAETVVAEFGDIEALPLQVDC